MTEPAAASPHPPRRQGWQWDLRTMILLVAAAAVAIAIVQERRRIAELTPRVDRVRVLARELVVADPTRMAAVLREATWTNDDRWDIHLPPGATYRLALATRAVGKEVPAAPQAAAPIAPGRHRVAFVQSLSDGAYKLALAVDGTPCLAVAEPLAWKISDSATGRGGQITTEQVPPGRPLILKLERFLEPGPNGSSTEPKQLGPGVAIWIEPAP